MGNSDIPVVRAGEWSDMDGNILEMILMKLPEASVVRAGSVCSRWHEVARSPLFTKAYTNQMGCPERCRFSVRSKYCFGVDESGHYNIRLAGRDYDNQMPNVACAEKYGIECSEGAGGLFYTFTGARRTQVLYKRSTLQQEWEMTPEMHFRKHDPIVGVVRTGGDAGAYKLVFAGGIADVQAEDEDLAVEIYDSVTKTWEIGSPLPYEFRGCTSSLFMSQAVHDGKFYAYDTYASFVSVLDLSTLSWSPVSVVRRPAEVKRSFLVGLPGGLRLVGIQDSGARDLCIHVWDVKEKTMELEASMQSIIIPNARPAPQTSFKRWYNWSTDQLGSALGIIVLLIAYAIVLCYGWSTSTGSLLQKMVMSANLRLPSLRGLRYSRTKDIITSPVHPSTSARQLNRLSSFLASRLR